MRNDRSIAIRDGVRLSHGWRTGAVNKRPSNHFCGSSKTPKLPIWQRSLPESRLQNPTPPKTTHPPTSRPIGLRPNRCVRGSGAWCCSAPMMLAPIRCAVSPRSLKPCVDLCRARRLPWREASMDGPFSVVRFVPRQKTRHRRRPVEFLAHHENKLWFQVVSEMGNRCRALSCNSRCCRQRATSMWPGRYFGSAAKSCCHAPCTSSIWFE